MRLIDADALVERIGEWMPHDKCGEEDIKDVIYGEACVDLIDVINEAPTVEQNAIDEWKNDFKEYINALDMPKDDYKGIIEYIDELPFAQAEQQWIPCSERLPNCNGCYLVWRPHFFEGEIGMPSICYFDGQNTWHDAYGVDFERVLSSDDVTAWMPLPDAYEVE